MLNGKIIKNFFSQAGVLAIVATSFSIPLSTSFTGIFSGCLLLCWVLSGKLATLPRLFVNTPSIFAALLLLAFFCVATLYSPIEFNEALDTLKKYRELIFFPIVVSLLMESKSDRRKAENGFLFGCITLLIISYLIYLSIIPQAKHGNSVIYHITHSYFMAILAFWSGHKIAEQSRYIYFWISIFILTVLNLVFVAPGRTGMLVFIVLISLLFIQRFSWKSQIIAFITLLLLANGSYFLSKNVSIGVDRAILEIQKFKKGKSRTSLGNRLNWYYNSMTLIKEKPIIGHGTGSFASAQRTILKGTKTLRTDNPHNEYLFIGVQLGGAGLFLFGLILLLQWTGSLKLPPPDRWLLQGVTVSMAVGCLMNSLLFDSLEGHYFVFLSSIILAGAFDKNRVISKNHL